MKEIEAQIIDIAAREIYSGRINIQEGRIASIERCESTSKLFAMPGLIDAHVHIESSLTTPEYYGRLALRQGIVATVSDPHELGNVLGVAGVEFMLKSGLKSPIKHFFTIPSCVPATPFDCSGAVISSGDVETLAASGRFCALSEVMNVPGVLAQDPEMMAKLQSAKRHHLLIDGHAPLLSGEDLKTYASHGITTDHECSELLEAQEKIALGMKIHIREGSSAKVLHTLYPIIDQSPNQVMFCSDDSSASDLLGSVHVRQTVKASLELGCDFFHVLRAACITPVEHYGLNVGQLRV
ncbi:MAG: amidohydrolase family protein [Akkermansia sp.]